MQLQALLTSGQATTSPAHMVGVAQHVPPELHMYISLYKGKEENTQETVTTKSPYVMYSFYFL